MKILVVDDDIVARKVLAAFLKQSNYEVQIVEDADSAFRALTAPDAPHVALVDWVMPDLTGPELCTKLRAHPFAVQPHLVIVSGRKEKADIAHALDAGADDFITKPFNIQETQARLRAAVRAVNRQLAFLTQIADLESTVTKQKAMLATPGPAAENPALRLAVFDPNQLDTVVAGALRHVGQNAAPRRAKHAGSTAVRTAAWAGILLPREALWLDLFLEIDDENLAVLIEQARTRRSGRTREPADFCAAIQAALRDSMHSVLRRMGREVLSPLPARAVNGSPMSDPELPAEATERHHYRVGAATFTLVIVKQASVLQLKTPEQLHLFDILAQPYPPANTQQVPLLRGGVALTEHVIEKVRLFAHAAEQEVPPIPIYSPSALSLHYGGSASAPA